MQCDVKIPPSKITLQFRQWLLHASARSSDLHYQVHTASEDIEGVLGNCQDGQLKMATPQTHGLPSASREKRAPAESMERNIQSLEKVSIRLNSSPDQVAGTY